MSFLVLRIQRLFKTLIKKPKCESWQLTFRCVGASLWVVSGRSWASVSDPNTHNPRSTVRAPGWSGNWNRTDIVGRDWATSWKLLTIIFKYFLFIAWQERSVWLQNTGSKNIQNVPFMHIYSNSKVRFAKICAFNEGESYFEWANPIWFSNEGCVRFNGQRWWWSKPMELTWSLCGWVIGHQKSQPNLSWDPTGT